MARSLRSYNPWIINDLRSGRKEYRSNFYTMLAELHIRNRSCIRRPSELRSCLRLDPSPELPWHLREWVISISISIITPCPKSMHGLAIRIDQQRNQVRPEQYYGEALFWLGKYPQAQKCLNTV